MEEDGYITVVPSFDTVQAARVFKGVYTLIGPDWADERPDPIGMIPIQIRIPEFGWSYQILEDAWTAYWKYTLGCSPVPGRWWMPQQTSAGGELYSTVNDWLKSHYQAGTNKGCPVAYIDQDMREQFYWSSLIPRQVIASACDACARPGSWTLTSSVLTWHLLLDGLVPRWDPLFPAGPIKQTAENSHLKDLDGYDNLCEEVWDAMRFDLDEDDEIKRCASLHDLDEENEQLADNVRREVAFMLQHTAWSGHKELWYPPERVMQQITNQLAAKSVQLERLYPLNRTIHPIVRDAMDLWESCASVQVRGVEFDG